MTFGVRGAWYRAWFCGLFAVPLCGSSPLARTNMKPARGWKADMSHVSIGLTFAETTFREK